MKLEENGHASASKRTRHFNIKYFYVTDLLQRKEFEIQYCPAKNMKADHMTKPLVGWDFLRNRDWLRLYSTGVCWRPWAGSFRDR